MTAQYEQDNINLRDGVLFTGQTPDAVTSFITLMGTLTVDGQGIIVEAFGGGTDPADPVTNNYSLGGGAGIAFRAGGVVTGGSEAFLPTVTGAGVAIGLTIVGNDVFLRVAGPAFPYDHRLKVSRIGFTS